ncbi:MAG: antibiotic biosynthesis monooxygenase [Chloroflexota bacterium]
MVFVVAVHLEARPERLDDLLATVRASLSAARTLHPGRRSTRVFQRLGSPTSLLEVTEWTAEEAFERFRQGSEFAEIVAACRLIPEAEPLQRLRHFERMDQRVAVAACATITAAPELAASVEATLLSEAHQQIARADGLVWREIYRSQAATGRLLVLHGWRALADLERFRESGSQRGEAALAALGATTTRFTGTLAAELSSLQP